MSLTKIEHAEIDYLAIAKKYNIEAKLNVVLPTIVAKVHIVGWKGILISALRYVLLKCLPSTRFYIDILDIETNDTRMLVENLKSALMPIFISSNCPECDFTINLVNKSQTYTYVSTHDIVARGCDIKKFVNEAELVPLGAGAYVKAKGIIRKESMIRSDCFAHDYTTLTFARDIDDNGTGTFEFIYSDHVDAATVVGQAFKYLQDLMSALANFDISLINNAGKYSLIIPFDRSLILANLIYNYLEDHYVSIGIKYLKCDTSIYVNYDSILVFNDVPDIRGNLKIVLDKMAALFKTLGGRHN
jgi:hypothetical protein